MKLNLIKFNCVKSTNDSAIKIIRSRKKKEGIVISNLQTNGKGTMGKKWISQKGNLFVSVFFELKETLPNFKEFSSINPFIIKKILNKYSTYTVKIKKPNDLLIKSKKVCGILQEVIKIERESIDVTLTAPLDGLILELHKIYPGAVFTEGSVLVTMVPTGEDLAVEFDISPKDISKLVPGSEIVIQLEALPAQKFGDLAGRLTYLSADTVAENLDGEEENIYRALAAIEKIRLRDTPPNFRLIPGMQVSGKIKVGERRLITYFIYPILRTLDSSFAEP